MYEAVEPVSSLVYYLEHICVVVMAVLHHHRLVTGQRERDAVLPSAVDSLRQQRQTSKSCCTPLLEKNFSLS